MDSFRGGGVIKGLMLLSRINHIKIKYYEFCDRLSVEFSVYKNPYNNSCQMRFSISEYTKIDVTPLVELTVLPRLISRGPLCSRTGVERRKGQA